MIRTADEVHVAARALAAQLHGISHWTPTAASRDRYESIQAELRALVAAIIDLGAVEPVAPPATSVAAAGRLAEEAVFVGGMHKSGTTLLRNLLDHHPELLVLPVDGVLQNVVLAGRPPRHDQTARRALRILLTSLLVSGPFSGEPLWALSGEPGRVAPYLELARYHAHWAQRVSSDPRGIFLGLVGALAGMAGGAEAARLTRWVIKGIFHPRVTPELVAAFPRARLVHIVRHPAAVIAAQQRKQILKRRQFDLFAELEALHEGFELALANQAALGVERYHVLRYEDLVADPAREMRRVAGFLGIAFDDILTRPTMYGRPTGANTAHPDRLGEVGRVSAATGEHWRQALAPWEVALVESYLGGRLDRLGYRRQARGAGAYLASLARVARQYRADPTIRPFRGASIARGLLRAIR
jgi:hypothetical protein